MNAPTFPGAAVLDYDGLRFEFLASGLRNHHDRLRAIQPQILEIAARSRGWETPDEIGQFEPNFKLGPLYEASGIALIWQGRKLVGLAATVNDWLVDDLAIVHLCGLGFLRQIQRRGLLRLLMALLLKSTLQNPALASALRADKLYLSAISQSPFILTFLSHAFTTFPTPSGREPDAEVLRVAEAVRGRFNGHLELEVPGLVLRDECRFFYKRFPRSIDRSINAMCERTLRYPHGDVFVIVSHPTRADLASFDERAGTNAHERMFRALLPGAAGARVENLGD